MNYQYQLPILLYHRIVNSKTETGKHKIYVFKNRFEAQLKYLYQNGYETLTFYDLMKNDTSDWRKKIILTFDDGYEDNYTTMFPVLKKYKFKAVIFLVTQQKNNSWGIRESEPVFKMLNKKQINEMSEYGIEFGGHTKNHLDLTKISEQETKTEIEGCKKDVENIIQKKSISFAYPYGATNEKIKSTVKNAGYHFGIATNVGANLFSDDPFEIRRIEIRTQNRLPRFKFKASGFYFQKSYIQQFFL
ncbi:MAG: polysaccharide deacetylase family protein [Bacteroidota bacterium]